MLKWETNLISTVLVVVRDIKLILVQVYINVIGQSSFPYQIKDYDTFKTQSVNFYCSYHLIKNAIFCFVFVQIIRILEKLRSMTQIESSS